MLDISHGKQAEAPGQEGAPRRRNAGRAGRLPRRRLLLSVLAGALLMPSLVLGGGPASAEPAEAAEQTLHVAATQDAVVKKLAPGANFGWWAQLSSRGEGAVQASYLEFQLPALPEGARLTDAALQVRATGAHGAATSARHDVSVTDGGWSEQTVTFDSRPALQQTVGTLEGADPNTVQSISLDAEAVTAFLGSHLSLAVHSDGNDGLWFWSKDHPADSYRPQLVLTFSTSGEEQPASPSTPPPAVTPGAVADEPFLVAPTGQQKVFAHYFPPYPVSIDNEDPRQDYYARNYLTADGEGGRHREYGGLLRDRPEGRAPLPGDWRATDMRSEVAAAATAGVDGYFVDVLSLSGANWDRTVELMKAAASYGNGFVVAPQLDTTASAGRSSARVVAAKMAELARMPAAYKLPSGEFVLAAFKAEQRPESWWREVITTLERTHGIPTVFMPVFLDATQMDRYADIAYAVGNWGVRNPGNTLAGPNYAARAHALGLKWIAPISVQDVRPNQGAYWESENLGNLRASWARAIQDGADLAVMNTWNDYSEQTSFAPSVAHGDVFLDVSAYYATQFKTGVAPSIVGDAAYVTHRTQSVGARPSMLHRLMALRHGERTPAQDVVEVQTLLTAPAEVRVSIGGRVHTYTAAAGVHVEDLPLAPGKISLTMTRNGRTIAVQESPFTVTSRPAVQDLQYYAFGTE